MPKWGRHKEAVERHLESFDVDMGTCGDMLQPKRILGGSFYWHARQVTTQHLLQ